MLMTRPSIENLNGKLSGKDTVREMENISRGPIFGDFVTTHTEASMQDITDPSPPSFKYNVVPLVSLCSTCQREKV
jgi:hypothetical protein